MLSTGLFFSAPSLRPHFAGRALPPAQPPEARSDEQAALLDSLIKEVKASKPFAFQARKTMSDYLPAALLRDILNENYEVHIKRRLRTARPDLHPDLDYTGGLHERGPKGNRISVAERVKLLDTRKWVNNGYWRNGVFHEVGHVVDSILGVKNAGRLKNQTVRQAVEKYGVSSDPAFRRAWKKDINAMPVELKQQWIDGLSNQFYYFLYERNKDGFRRARQETFAEAFDILLRGKGSTFNYHQFAAHFPHSLAAVRKLTLAAYPDMRLEALPLKLDVIA